MNELSELGVLIVDCQTTGATPTLGAVLEVGWGVARASRDEMSTFKRIGSRFPRGTTWLSRFDG